MFSTCIFAKNTSNLPVFPKENRWELKKKVSFPVFGMAKMMVEKYANVSRLTFDMGLKVIKTCLSLGPHQEFNTMIMRISVKIRYGILNSHALATSSIGSDLNF